VNDPKDAADRRADEPATTDELLLAVPPIQHIRAHVFEFAFAVVTLISGILFFADSGFVHRTVLGRDLHANLDEVWYTLYIIGGVQILLGLYFDSRPVFGRFALGRRIEVAGVILTGTAATVEALTLYVYVGVGRAALMTTALAFGCFHRAIVLWIRPRIFAPVPVGGLPHQGT
jgi:hypothetical protein